MRILLDAGHGGSDLGTFHFNVAEKTINFKIVEKCFDFLNLTHDISLTRESDNFLDLKERLSKTNENDILISVHCNASIDARAHGFEIWYKDACDDSEILANDIKNKFSELPFKNRGIKKNVNFFLLKKSPIPTILIECGFLSNSDDFSLLNHESFQTKIALKIVNGISNYVKRLECL